MVDFNQDALGGVVQSLVSSSRLLSAIMVLNRPSPCCINNHRHITDMKTNSTNQSFNVLTYTFAIVVSRQNFVAFSF